ncbi:MAG: hypothetical protein JWM78_3662 [Verrucomicrobiaceae bacterium]|nr:hypothetical protein [Verrucomicrobiaceae bacterium]
MIVEPSEEAAVDNNKEIERRDFIKGLGTGAAVSVAAASLGAASSAFSAPMQAKTKTPQKWHYEADIVIVGFGGAGAAAALEAANAGASVIVLEKGAEPGGATHFSGGVVYASETTVQRAAGVKDSQEEMYKFLMNVGGDSVDPELVRTYVKSATGTVEWLIDIGVEFPPTKLYQSGLEHVAKYATTLPPPRRGHQPVGNGYGLFSALRSAVEQKGVKVLLETAAVELVPSASGEIGGVKAKNKDAEIYIRARKAVVLTAGDFNRSKEMCRAHSPIALAAKPIGPHGHTGDGLRMAQAWGADILGTYAIGGLPVPEEKPVAIAAYMPTVSLSGNAPIVAVNKSGKRFFNETIGYVIANVETFKQDDSYTWTIFDDKARTGDMIVYPSFTDPKLAWSHNLDDEVAQGIVRKGQTFRELAAAIGVPADAFENTMNQYNINAKNGKDLEFGKTAKLGPIDTGPYYAIKTRPGMLVNAGGLKIDTRARVIDVFGNIIPKLYAAGMSMTGGFTGELIATSGYCVGLGITFGRIAAQNAVAEVKV